MSENDKKASAQKVWKEENMVWNRVYYGHDVMERILENIDKKHALLSRHWVRYLCRAMMAGALVILFYLFSTQVKTDLGVDFNPALTNLIASLSFSMALVFIFFTNSELLTSNFMYFTVGQYYRKIRLPNTLKVLGICLLGNLLGCLLVGVLVRSCQMLDPAVVASLKASVVHKTVGSGWWLIFVKAIFANFFINVAVIISMQVHESISKMLALMMGVLVFAYMGFEHVIANSALFVLVFLFDPANVDLLHMCKNFIWALLGNFVGGGLVIGLFYAYLNDHRKQQI